MQIDVKKLFISCLFLLGAQNLAFAKEANTWLKGPLYAGVEFGIVSKLFNLEAHYKNKYGKEAYGPMRPKYNFFMGVKFLDRVGFEIGYERQKRKVKLANLRPGDCPPGFDPLENGSFMDLLSTTRMEHLPVGLTFDLWVCPNHRNSSLWIEAGLSRTKIRAAQELVDDEMPGLPTPEDKAMMFRSFEQVLWIPQVKIGTHYYLTDHLGVRVSGAWYYTSRFRMRSKERPDTRCELRLKDSFTAALGVFAYF